MSARRFGVIVAAGAGQRLGSEQPKAFVDLGGTPLLVHSARAMAAVCSRIIVVVGDGHVDQGATSLAAAGIDATLCVGGATRTDSVCAGLLACHGLGTRPNDLVGVHDAARPLASVELIGRTFAAAGDGWDATAPGLPVVDTLKLVDADDAVLRTVDRRGLWTVQTPQVFRWAMLEHVYLRKCPETSTDDLGLVERAGCRVRLIPGETTNLKITYSQDLAMAEALLRGRQAPAGGDRA
ncbi:MAG: 2-C-methyl-D-erythritol 4-phosphate cytidylyltransferase [Egibacteraceae bacterium]